MTDLENMLLDHIRSLEDRLVELAGECAVARLSKDWGEEQMMRALSSEAPEEARRLLFDTLSATPERTEAEIQSAVTLRTPPVPPRLSAQWLGWMAAPIMARD